MLNLYFASLSLDVVKLTKNCGSVFSANYSQLGIIINKHKMFFGVFNHGLV